MTPQGLKNSILQLAIQGKLVEHLESEKGVAVHSSYGGEIADFFEIPDNWKWLAIKDVATVVTGLSFKKQDQKDASNGSLRVLRGGNIGDDYKYYLYEDDIYVDLEQFQLKYVSLLKGDIITPSVTSLEKICKTGFIDKDLHSVTAGGFVYIIRYLSDNIIDAKYLLYFISSTFNKEQCKPNIHKSGQAFYNLKKSGFVEQPICVPPLAEQKRIVAKIEELLPCVDRYEQAWKRLEEFNKRFPIDMQKSLLQWAIQGKLVEQRPEEGTADELYQQILEEKQWLVTEGKIKKEKPLPEIAEDEVPFEIPVSWKWVRLSQISVLENGDRSSKYPVERDYVDFGIPFFGAKDMNGFAMAFDNVRYISEDKFSELGNGKLKDKDFVCLLRGSVGKCAVFTADEQHKTGFICAQMVIIRSINHAICDYLQIYLSSPFYFQYIESKITGTAVRQLPAKELGGVPIPLPPLAEQKRIVAKLEGLLPLCERLK